ESLVGLFVKRSAEMVVGLFGILKAGGAYVPLDPAYPKERLAHMISDAKMPVIVTQEALAAALPDSSAKLLMIEHESSNSADSQNRLAKVTGENLAYVIYTSGSTGKPKGVQIPHRAVVNLLVSIAFTTKVSASDHLLAVTTFSFDIAALEIFLPLILGAKLTIVSRETTTDGLQLAALIKESNATVMQATPATWRLLIEGGWKGSPSLKIFCGGEALTRKLADDLLPRAKEVWNLYGPTETTIWSAAWKVEADKPISIGRPLANTQFYILDKSLQPVPVCVAGELYLGGDGLARGYFIRTELTAEKFLANPFVKGQRIFKTGDLARYWPDGTVECLGRSDHQVKIRGFRIELGDIESALRQGDGIKEALVMAREDVPGDKRLVAYLATNVETAPSVPALRDFLKSKLPEYMVPGIFVFLATFPLTPSGKIDRTALPAPDSVRPELGKQFVPPATPLEIEVAQIWSEVFRIDQVGRDDNFFELGGHSLLAIQITARLRQKLGVELALPSIFKSPTVGRLAETILESMIENSSDEDSTLQWLDELSEEDAKKLLASS
ncbi:MAG: non-ribosomal peptide synthetase, partial [Verrucomicrobiota bacterium]